MLEQDKPLIKTLNALLEGIEKDNFESDKYQKDLEGFIKKRYYNIASQLVLYAQRIDKRIILGTSVVFLKDKSVLLGLRKNTRCSGSWGFPGGKVEKGEYLLEGAQRELIEETGINASPEYFKYLTHTEDIFDGNHFTTHYFVIKVTEEIEAFIKPKLVEPDKCEEWRWVKISDLRQYNLFPAVDNLLDKIDEDQTFRFW